MPVDRFNPGDRAPSPGYTEIAVASGRRLVLFAGQCPLDPAGQVVGGDDVEAQTRVVVANLRTCMDAAGAGPDDILKSTVSS